MVEGQTRFRGYRIFVIAIYWIFTVSLCLAMVAGAVKTLRHGGPPMEPPPYGAACQKTGAR